MTRHLEPETSRGIDNGPRTVHSERNERRRDDMADLRDIQLTEVGGRHPQEKVDIYQALLTLRLYGLATDSQEHLIDMMAADTDWYREHISHDVPGVIFSDQSLPNLGRDN